MDTFSHPNQGMYNGSNEPSEYGGDGRRKQHPLRDVYQPPGDPEGATFQGVRPLTAKERRARNK